MERYPNAQLEFLKNNYEILNENHKKLPESVIEVLQIM